MISKTFEKLKDQAYRTAFVASQINIGIPFQIRALLKSRPGWTQQKLAAKTGMLQPRISGLMTPGRVRPNIETLRRVAEAFDCALIVRFAPFSELARWSEEFEPDSFTIPSFDDDIGFIERKSSKSAGALVPHALAAGGRGTSISINLVAGVGSNSTRFPSDAQGAKMGAPFLYRRGGFKCGPVCER